MKNYTITVNGNVYNVTVEEGTTAGAAPVVSARDNHTEFGSKKRLKMFRLKMQSK